MAINKVVYGSNTLVDLTSDTVTPQTLAAGATAHAANGEIITGAAYKNIYYVKGTQTAATGTWTGVLEEIDELYEGLCIDYWLPFAGSGNATLNLTLKDGTATGAVPVYFGGTTRFTTHVGANNIIHLVYQTVTISNVEYTGWWMDRNQDNNTTDITNLYEGSSAYVADSVVYRYQLLFQTDKYDNRLTPLNNNSNATGTTKTMLTSIEFDPFGSVFYYNSTTTANANANMTTALYYHRNGVDLRYTFNCGKTLIEHKDFYLVVTPQANGKVKLASVTPWAQELPTTNDGHWYIFLGRTYSTYQFVLYTEHPVYYHDGTELRRLQDIDLASTTTAGLMSASDKTKLNNALTEVTPTTEAIGSASAGTAISADDITAWSAGTLPSASYNSSTETLSLSFGSLPSLSYTERSIPNISVTSKTVVTDITSS